MSGARPTSLSPDADERTAALALALTEGVGCIRFHELLARFGTARRALDDAIDANRRIAAESEVERAMQGAARCGARLLLSSDTDFPPPLRDLREIPPFLFVVGDLTRSQPPSVAIVGTRKATAYGVRVAREIASALARGGACVISGMARGIDATAHRAALDAGGRTVAVLGTGVAVAYPAGHQSLQRTIARDGAILSEWAPDDAATPGSFPRRNRVIAALAQVTVVVEAGERSGALITAEHALELGRTVAAVPGPIDQLSSAGTNALLRDGAQVIASVADALALLGLTPPLLRPVADTLTDDERAVWEALTRHAPDLDELSARSRLPARRCLVAVTALELTGAIECALTGEIRRRLS